MGQLFFLGGTWSLECNIELGKPVWEVDLLSYFARKLSVEKPTRVSLRT